MISVLSRMVLVLTKVVGIIPLEGPRARVISALSRMVSVLNKVVSALAMTSIEALSG